MGSVRARVEGEGIPWAWEAVTPAVMDCFYYFLDCVSRLGVLGARAQQESNPPSTIRFPMRRRIAMTRATDSPRGFSDTTHAVAAAREVPAPESSVGCVSAPAGIGSFVPQFLSISTSVTHARVLFLSQGACGIADLPTHRPCSGSSKPDPSYPYCEPARSISFLGTLRPDLSFPESNPSRSARPFPFDGQAQRRPSGKLPA